MTTPLKSSLKIKSLLIKYSVCELNDLKTFWQIEEIKINTKGTVSKQRRYKSLVNEEFNEASMV